MKKSDVLRLIDLYDAWIDMKDEDILCYEGDMPHSPSLYDGELEIIEELNRLCEMAESMPEDKEVE